MSPSIIGPPGNTASAPHSHVFLGSDHARSERQTWTVIVLCGAMMVLEIAGGLLFGSIAVVADGLHMSTHAGALLLAALAYAYARRHAEDTRFTFGTGKFGDLAGFTSAIVLGMIALLIGYESVARLFAPVPIRFEEAIPIAVLGLLVNIVSAWLLSRNGQGHAHDHGSQDHHNDHHHGHAHAVGRDNNMRAALVHVAADAAVSVLVIVALVLARAFGWPWIDPAAGIVGALVIANWAYGLLRDTSAILLDMIPDAGVAAGIRTAVEADGDEVADLHLWRLGPGHLGAILAVVTGQGARHPEHYHRLLARFPALSHVSVEVQPRL